MSKLILVFTLLLLALSCTTSNSNNVSVDTYLNAFKQYRPQLISLLPTPSNQVALETVLNVAQAGPFNFRGQALVNQSPATFIFSWRPTSGDRGSIALRVLDEAGVDLFYKSGDASIKGLRAILLGTMNVQLSKTQSVASKGPVHYKKLDNGSLAITFSLTTKGIKAITQQVDLSFKLRVSNFNALNLWDANPNNTREEQLYIYDIFRPEFSNWYDPYIQKRKTQNLIKEIRVMQLPEIIALQEIESAGNASEVFKKGSMLRKELEKLGYNYFLIGPQEPNNPVALTTAFISTYPLENGSIPFNVNLKQFSSLSGRDKKIASYTTRDIQVVKLTLGKSTTLLYNNHWRSQGCGSPSNCFFSNKVRLINASVLRSHIQKTQNTNKSKNSLDLIVLGDLNTSYYTDIMRSLGSTGNEAFVQSGMRNDFYYNLWYELPAKKRFEASHHGQYDTLGQFLIDQGMYDNLGLQYVNNSYKVIGQTGTTAQILQNADGNPFRWQQFRIKLKDVSANIRANIDALLKRRGCRKNSSKRRCNPIYFEFMGQGFSDHLPMVADFNYIGNAFSKKAYTSFNPSSTKDIKTPPVLNTIVSECSSDQQSIDSYPALKELDLSDHSNFRKCAKIDAAQAPYPLHIRGLYNSNYIVVNKQKIDVTLMRSFDPRNFINGKIEHSTSTQMEPGSNMCFARKVLQGKGGKISFAYGRIGYSNGHLALLVERREHIKLTDLPSHKLLACKPLRLKREY
ncbi:MAG: hypothetical protein ISR65_10830 [Bacteriovoracaceae bacterium]|nr:hypothetical protein [Bacteriovoracaceae bacterium]